MLEQTLISLLKVNMATIISEADVAAALEEALAEHSGDMENSFSDHEENSHETKLQTIRYSFEPKNKNAEEINDMNEYVLSYFESLNSMSRRIIAEQREVMAEQGNKWDNLTPEEQERLIDDRIANPAVRKHYFVDETFSTRKPEWFPVLRLAHGISGSDRSVMNPRDSITSVTDYHSKDQFSSPWSWETRSQQDLRILGEGELETQLKLTIEADLKRLHLPAAAESKKKELNDVEIESKDSSQSDSIPGSEPLSRKQFLAVDFDGLKEHSSASSVQGSKSSLGSSSSLLKGGKSNLGSTTPPKGIKANLSPAAPTEDSKGSLSSTAAPKGSKTSLSSSSLTQTEPKPQKEDANNRAVESDDTKDLDLSTATNSSDFMALFQNW